MITVIAEHSVNLELLPIHSNVLDLGCRGFEFTDQLRALGHSVYPVDIDTLETRKNYHRIAISHRNGFAKVQIFPNDPQSTRILPDTNQDAKGDLIEMMTIAEFSKRNGVEKWDLIKIDIEGEEYKILESAQHPMATQVSVEFHEHTDRKIGKERLDDLLLRLSKFYVIYNQNWEARHGAGFNYWDILLIKR